MEAVFQPENFRIFSGDLRAFRVGKNGKLARNQWKKSGDFPARIMASMFPLISGVLLLEPAHTS
jgi:hypothetical protein